MADAAVSVDAAEDVEVLVVAVLADVAVSVAVAEAAEVAAEEAVAVVAEEAEAVVAGKQLDNADFCQVRRESLSS